MVATRRTRFRVEEIVPSAARTVASLRDIGYSTAHAIADLIDNSVAAGASQVDVTLHFDGADSWIRVADDGEGMDAATLLESLRYGSRRGYATDDLGKFGFGLKTASTSQCRRVTVASRRSPQYARLEVRCLDLDHIGRTNQWQVLVLDGPERPSEMTEPLRAHTGTVVLWQDLDRILEYKDPWGEWARRKLLALAEEVDVHLGMVFHRFLAGEVRGRRLRITVNGSPVEAWDPFCRSETRTEELPAKDLVVAGDEGMGIVRVRPYVLPRQSEFSSDAAWGRAGRGNWAHQQGLYVYRAHRMVQSGGWNRLRTADEHTKMARVSLDFFPDLDAVFGVNITKAYVNLPEDLRGQLEALVSQVTRRADQRYRTGVPTGTGGSTGGGRRHREADGQVDGGRPDVTDAGERTGAPSGPRVRPRRAIEDAAATAGQQEALNRIVQALRERYPEVARDLGW